MSGPRNLVRKAQTSLGIVQLGKRARSESKDLERERQRERVLRWFSERYHDGIRFLARQRDVPVAHVRGAGGRGILRESERLVQPRGKPAAREGETRQVVKRGEGIFSSPASLGLLSRRPRAALDVPRLSLFLSVLSRGISEYLLEPRLSRSFSLGRKALTSAFHCEGTTGHVDRGVYYKIYILVYDILFLLRLGPETPLDLPSFSFFSLFLLFDCSQIRCTRVDFMSVVACARCPYFVESSKKYANFKTLFR